MSKFQKLHEKSQRRAISFLLNPKIYKQNILKVDLIETHGSYIFLAGRYAYKMKREVSFNYMDFSTLELRYAACKRELELNAPHAPEIYLGLKSITEENDGSLVFDGTGKPVEWLVHMSRFEEHNLLSQIAEAGPLPNNLSKAIAEVAFRSHEEAPHFKDHKFGNQINAIIADVFTTLKKMVPYLKGESILNLESNIASNADNLSGLLARREEEGLVRRCHGDMHLSNIVLIKEKPVLFDALEFNEEMATTDIFYDLAFLLMDLDHKGQRHSANVILNRYLWLSSKLIDIEGLKALPLFLSLRAAIRGMVRGQQALQTNEIQSVELFKTSQSYIDRAASYFINKPLYLILIGGLSGSGKSTLAAQLSPYCGRCPGALLLRSDLERKRVFSVSELDRLPQKYYTKEINERIYSILLSKTEAALHAGHSVIADAVFAKAEERERIEFLAKQYNAKLFTFWLDAPASVLIKRVGDRKMDASDATKEVIQRQLQYDIGNLTWARLDASGTPDQIFSKVREKMKEHLEIL